MLGGAHRNRTDQAICLQGKSGFLARTPKSVVGYANDSFDSHSLAAFIDNFTVGTVGWTRTTFSPLKRRDSRPLSYDGRGLVQRLGVEPSRSAGREGYSLAGVRPRLTLRNGAQCRLSACDLRFVGPLLFTSELTRHGWRPQRESNSPPAAWTVPPHPRCEARNGCRPAARTQHVRINSPVPTPGGTVGKE